MPYKVFHKGNRVGVFVIPVAGIPYYRIFARYTADPNSEVYDTEDEEGLIRADEPFGRSFAASGALTLNVIMYNSLDTSTNAGVMGAQTVNTASSPEPCGMICDGSDWLFAVPLICDGSEYVPHLPNLVDSSGAWKG